MVLTSKEVERMHLKMAKMMRDRARKEGNDEIANLDLETIVELHKQALKKMGYTPKKLPN